MKNFRITSTRIRGRFCLTVLSLCLSLFSLESRALEYPHNSSNTYGIQCDTCHNDAKAAAFPDWWTNQEANICGQCHNTDAVIGTDVVTHKKSDGTTVIVQCTACHDPHSQMQNRTWTIDSYLYTSASDTTPGSVTTSTLKKTGANWNTNNGGEWKGMLLIPNVKYQKFAYKILSNTADTITIDTTGTAPDNAINTTNCKPGNTFAIVYGKLIRENINEQLIRFFRATGTNSFVDGLPVSGGFDTNVDGICQVCHDDTKYFRSDGRLDTAASGLQHPASAGVDCVQCHAHDKGFKASCNSCHGTPPVENSRGGTTGLAENEGGTGSATEGAHEKHAAAGGLHYSCYTCHTGGMPKTTIYDKTIQIGFSIFNGAYQGGSYDGRAVPLANAYTYTAGNPGTTVTRDGAMTCTVYCHGSSLAIYPDPAPQPAWNAGANAYSCSSAPSGACHGASPSNPPTLGSHPAHAGDSGQGYDGGMSYSCSMCHSGFPAGHVNGSTEWSLNSAENPRLAGANIKATHQALQRLFRERTGSAQISIATASSRRKRAVP